MVTYMISIEDMQTMLDDIASDFPQEFFEKLNGGIILLPESRQHEKSIDRDLYIMGEYHRGGAMGRYIAIYYGSFMRVYGHIEYNALKEKLLSTIKHEFRHHIESLAGSEDLERDDEQHIAQYLGTKDNALQN